MSVVVRTISLNSRANATRVCATLTNIATCKQNNKKIMCCKKEPKKLALVKSLLRAENGHGDCVLCLQPLAVVDNNPPKTSKMKKKKDKKKRPTVVAVGGGVNDIDSDIDDSDIDSETDMCDSDCETDCDD